MQRHFSKVALATGVLAIIGVGVWNAIELRQLREQLAVKSTETETVPAVAQTKATPDMDVPKELLHSTNPPITVAPPDILHIDVKAEGMTSLAPIRGEHLVRPDGTIGLGQYGNVYVAGMTIPLVKTTLTEHLKRFLKEFSVEVEVAAFNSRWYYVVNDFGAKGESVCRIPATGNETVLDALAQVGGLNMDSGRKMWIARRGPGDVEQILPVDWAGITQRGHTRTNYQLLPDDRVYVKKAD